MFRAKEFGHPDLAGLRDKALAARDTPAAGPFRGSDDMAITFAAALALTDPDTARVLLARAVPPAERAAVTGIQQRETLIALALADPAAFGPVAEAVIARGRQERNGYLYTGLDAIALILTQPDRLGWNMTRYARLYGEFEEE